MPEALDRLKEGLAAFIRWVMRDVTYHKQYPCTVQSQSGMTVDLMPDDESIAGSGLSGVPLRVGLPGWEVTLAPRSRVMLSFDNGDPKKPAAALFDPGSVIDLSFDGGTRGVARIGDPVLVFINPAIPIPMTGTVGGAPFVGTIQITSTVSGIIQSGNPKLRA
jgi:hypothetical protein